MFSVGYRSGDRGGRNTGVKFCGNREVLGGVPSGAIEREHGAADPAADLVEVPLHGVGIGLGARPTAAPVPRAGQIAPKM